MDAPDPAELAQKNPIGTGILAAAALIGGSVIGAAAMAGIQEGIIPKYEIPDDQPLHEEITQFLFASGGVVLGGAALAEMIKSMGRDKFLTTMATYGLGMLGLKLIIDGFAAVARRRKAAA
jgi:hypothetical protein